MSVDPKVAETGQPYAFAADDPLNATDPLGEFCLELHCILGDISSVAGAISAVTALVPLPVFAAISETAAGIAVAADITNCLTGHCNYLALGLDALALIPGGAALHFASGAARDAAEIRALKELGEVDKSLEESKGFKDLLAKLLGLESAKVSGASVVIAKSQG